MYLTAEKPLLLFITGFPFKSKHTPRYALPQYRMHKTYQIFSSMSVYKGCIPQATLLEHDAFIPAAWNFVYHAPYSFPLSHGLSLSYTEKAIDYEGNEKFHKFTFPAYK